MSAVLKVLAVFLIIVLVALLGFKLYDYIQAFHYYNNSKVMFATPGVADSNFVPQGMTYDAENKIYYFAGYMSDNTASRVYVRYEDGTVTYTELLDMEGNPYTGHAGGMEVFDKYVYVVGEESKGVDVFMLSDILGDSKTATMIGNVKTYNAPAQIYAYTFDEDRYVIVGSYHKDETDYQTPEHERITTPSGDENYSVMTVFKLSADEEETFGIVPEPVAIISAREMIQGICITPDRQMVVSTSWGLATSELFFYDLDKVQHVDNYVFKSDEKVKDKFEFTLPCYFVDDSCLVNTVVAPPMSEELVYFEGANGEGRIVVFCESACNKYIFGKLTTGFNVFGYKYEKIR